jgi:hypothetical protein
MNTMTRLGLVFAATAALAGCDPKKQETAPAPSATARVSDEQIATPADFEEQAATEITEDNVEQELAKVEKEISE